MELLRGTAPKVKFYGPTPDTDVDAVTYSVNGVVPVSGTFAPVSNEPSAWEVQLPYIGSDTNDIEVVWTFTIENVPSETFSETLSYEAVTPYLTRREIRSLYAESGQNPTDEQCDELESMVRHIINAHTGQKFGFDSNKTLTVEGHGEGALRLPERLVNLTGVSTFTDILDARSIIVVSDGWYLKKRWTDVIGRRTTTDTYFGEDSRLGGIIVAPSMKGRASSWRDDYPFDITGDWGYKSIPPAVKQAAGILANDYACGEAMYRDRYLESIKAADWRMQFTSRAWEYTGNVKADQLLSEYVILDWAVV